MQTSPVANLWLHTLTGAGVMVIVASLSASGGGGQWLERTPGLSRTPDGRPNLSAPAPRTSDGKPDLSGLWVAEKDPSGVAGGIEGIVAPKYMINILQDLTLGDLPLQPEAAALYKQRAADLFKDNPLVRCLPAGVPRLNAYTHPYKIVQTPGLIVVLYESLTMFRQIFTDGRSLPKDPEPTWMGYSVGSWEGDTLVVHTAGFNDKSWLDGSGHPHTDAMRLTERFRRRDVGHMDIEMTIDDPKSYNRPVTYTQPQELLPDAELIEYICNENNEANFPQILRK